MFIYKDEELPEGTICTQRLFDMIKFKEYKGFIFKCRRYCENRNIELDTYIDDPKYLMPYTTRVYFLPFELAIGIVENVRMTNVNRGPTLKYLYELQGEKIHVQLQERKAEEFVVSLQTVLSKFGIETCTEYCVITENAAYRIDLYIPKYKLAIEFDEYHHTAKSDIYRETSIQKHLGCSFIRVKESNPLSENLATVLVNCLTCRV